MKEKIQMVYENGKKKKQEQKKKQKKKQLLARDRGANENSTERRTELAKM